MPSHKPVRLALIGAGLFARDAHVPAIHALGDTYELVAIYNHRLSTAEALAEQIDYAVDLTDDLDALLARDDIEAVDVLVPIPHMPDTVRRALDAGKHVISEKPVSPDVVTGQALLAHYAGRRLAQPDQVWMVAENFRYETALVQAAELIADGAIGRVVAADWIQYIDMTPANKYYGTAWRRSASFPGGFILDGGVHNVAALRMLLGEVASVTATVTQSRPDLPPADTFSAALHLESGALVTYAATFAAGANWSTPLRVVGENGSLAVTFEGITLTRGDSTEEIAVSRVPGVEGELAEFALAIRDGKAHRNTPQQAVQDVAVIEAILNASETGQRCAPEQIAH